MRYVTLPNTDLTTSRVCLGSNRFGTQLDRRTSFELLDTFVENGGTFVDTAHVYANWIEGASPSASEKTIGDWLAQRGNRDGLVIGTKGGHPDLADPHTARLSRAGIERDLDESLRFLKTEYIDLYWLHRDDPATPVNEIMETLHRVVQAGKARYVGCSNWHVSRIEEANGYASAHGLTAFVANQPMWSLAQPNAGLGASPGLITFTQDAHDFHCRTGMAVVPYSSQAQGFFSKLDDGDAADLPATVRDRYLNSLNLERYQRSRVLARAHGASTAQIALGYLVSQPFVTIPIVGCRTRNQVIESVRGADVRLTDTEIAFLEGPT